MSTGRPATITAVLLAASGALAAAYWLLMSSYSQALGPFPHRSRNPEKVVALTFDDGPNPPYTEQIAQILSARGVSATFFQVGRCVQRHPGTTAALAAAGHVIGNHSFSHRFSRCLLGPSQHYELLRTQEILHGLLGRTPTLYRPPWLLRVPPLLRTLEQQGMHPVSGVFCHPLEVTQWSAARIAAAAIRRTRPGRVLIFHDGVDGRGGNRAATVAAVEIVVDTLRARGYRFVTVDQLLTVPAYTDRGGEHRKRELR